MRGGVSGKGGCAEGSGPYSGRCGLPAGLGAAGVRVCTSVCAWRGSGSGSAAGEAASPGRR